VLCLSSTVWPRQDSAKGWFGDYRFDFFPAFLLIFLEGFFVDFLVVFFARFEAAARFTAAPLAFFLALVFAISGPSWVRWIRRSLLRTF